MYFLLLDELTSAFTDGVRTLFYSIDSLIYKLIIYLYNLFDMLCRGRILDNEFVQEISFRVGLILGLVMFFRVVFSLLQMLINPDTINDKEKGAFNIVKRCLITIVLLGITPYMFDYAYKLQDIVLGSNSESSNIIARFLLPSSVQVDTEKFGSVFSENLLFSFYSINDSLDSEEYEQKSPEEYEEIKNCEIYHDVLKNEIEVSESFDFGYNCLNKKVSGISSLSQNNESVYVMRYNYLFSTAVGIMVCWFLLVYCFSVGVRVVELAFLQIISPMAVISYMSPKKDGMFQKWIKMCLATYLDMFIRVAIINFVILLISMVMESVNGGDFSLFWITTGAYGAGVWYRRFLMIIIILALLQFAKKAPDLIKEFFPDSKGKFGFSLKNREVLGQAMAAAGGIAAGSAIGLVSGVAGGKGFSRVTGALGGVLGGAGRGVIGGVKNKGASFSDITKGIGDVRKKQADVGARRAAVIAGGSTFFGRNLATLQKSVGMETAADVDTREIGYMDTYSKFLDNMKAAADNNGDVGKLKRAMDVAQQNGDTDAFEAARKRYKNAQKAYISAALGDERFIVRDNAGNKIGFRFNNTDGSWDDFDANGNFKNKNGSSVIGLSYNYDTDDPSYTRQIVAIAGNANNYQQDYANVLGNLEQVVDYGTIENNINEVNARKVERQNSRTFTKNQANNKFSTKK